VYYWNFLFRNFPEYYVEGAGTRYLRCLNELFVP
jgi:hypothetical protein